MAAADNAEVGPAPCGPAPCGPAGVADVLDAAGEGTPPPSDRELADLPRNDYGNGQRFLARQEDRFLCVTELQRDTKDGWLVWRGMHWSGEAAWPEAQRAAHSTAQAIRGEADALDADASIQEEMPSKEWDERVKRHRAFATSSGNAARVSAMLGSAAPYLGVRRSALDADPDLLALPNGTLDLSQSPAVLRPASRADRLTRVAAAPFEEGADCPRFRALAARVLPDPAVRNFVQRYLGYCLTGHVGEQLLCLWYGHGANGKSTILNILRGVMGDHHVGLDFSSLAADPGKRGSDATPDLLRLPGVRLASAAEPEQGTVLSESLIKQQTGGEPVNVRPLFGNPFEFRPTHKLILSFNNYPRIKSQDHGTWRRLALVHFGVTIPKDEQDPLLERHIIETEASGVLNWLLDGLYLWREHGLAVPEAVRDATADYKADSDPLARFLDDCTRPPERGEPDTVRAGRLYEVYSRWCGTNGEDPVSKFRFGKLMRERPGVREARLAKGVRAYRGLVLAEDLLDEWAGR